jgi:hypothetical protein
MDRFVVDYRSVRFEGNPRDGTCVQVALVLPW